MVGHQRYGTRDAVFTEAKDLTEDIENLPLYVKELKNKYGKRQNGRQYCKKSRRLRKIKNACKNQKFPDGYSALVLAEAARRTGDVLHICRDDAERRRRGTEFFTQIQPENNRNNRNRRGENKRRPAPSVFAFFLLF